MQKYLSMSFFLCNFASRFDGNEGKMLEWLKRHAWKACKPQKGFRGSNPRLSAKGTNDCIPVKQEEHIFNQINQITIYLSHEKSFCNRNGSGNARSW